MIVLNTPNGFSVDVPENINEDTSIRFNIIQRLSKHLNIIKTMDTSYFLN